MLTVGDIMTREVMTLSDTDRMDDAAWRLTLRGVGGAPVTDKDGNLVGMLSKSDLIDPDRPDYDGATTVEDVMFPAVFALPRQAPAMDAAKYMVSEGVHRLLVLDDAGKLAGIVTTMDLLKALVRTNELTLDADAPTTERA
jgi:predicted transcriptional regulator